MISPVERADDPRLREYAQVGNHGWLTAQGLFVAEGRLLLRRLLQSGRFPIRSILITPAALHSFGAPVDTDAPIYVADPAILHQVTGFNFHRGCLALAHRPPDEDAGERFADARLLLALEGVGNPDNVGGLFRVAAAFGVDGVLLDPSSGDPFYRKAVRTSMGAVLNVPWGRVVTWPGALDAYRRLGFKVVALTPGPAARPLAEFASAATGPLVLMVGAEGPGLSEAAMAMADARVRIPIAPDVDSLNVAVAAGIALSYLLR